MVSALSNCQVDHDLRWMVLKLYCHQYCIYMLFSVRRFKEYARDLAGVGMDCFKVLSVLSRENRSTGSIPIGTCFKTAFCVTYCVLKLGKQSVRNEYGELRGNIYRWVWKTQLENCYQKQRTVGPLLFTKPDNRFRTRLGTLPFLQKW